MSPEAVMPEGRAQELATTGAREEGDIRQPPGQAPRQVLGQAPGHVLSQAPRHGLGQVLGQTQEVSYLEAIREALFEEMAEDPSVFCLGEDIGHFGGAFKVTRGLLEAFGPDRVLDTPIAESLLVGVAIGAAIRGLRPVVEMQFADFVTCGFSQIVNNAATFHYRLGVSVPLVIRLPSGGGIGAGPFHSRNPEAWFTHAPGLKVVAPATAADAKGLLRAAIRDPDPVIFLEQKYLYRREKAERSEVDQRPLPIGVARVARTGVQATLVTYGNGVSIALEAAARLESEGASIEVIDLRTLVPWDFVAVLRSVEKTGRVLVLHEATRTAGFGAEIAAVIAELAFEHLDAPVRRLASPETPTPAESGLEAFVRPSADKTVDAVRWLLAY